MLQQARQGAGTDFAMGLVAGGNNPQTLLASRRGAQEGFRGRVFDLFKEQEFLRMDTERKKRESAVNSVIGLVGEESPIDAQLAAADPQTYIQEGIKSRFASVSPGESWRVLTPQEVEQAGLDPKSDWQMNTATKKIDKLYSPPAAPQTTIMMPGQEKFAEVMAADSVERLRAADTSARAAIGSIFSVRTAAKSLDKAVVGTGAELRTSFGRLLNSLGLSNGDGLAATSQFLNSTGQLAAEMLASKIFGAGTGISQKDLEFAIGLVGNDQSLTRAQIQRILSIRDKMGRAQIGRYNELRQTVGSDPRYAPYMGTYPEIQTPEPIQWVAPGTVVTE
jgi:hypothetical protein